MTQFFHARVAVRLDECIRFFYSLKERRRSEARRCVAEQQRSRNKVSLRNLCKAKVFPKLRARKEIKREGA